MKTIRFTLILLVVTAIASNSWAGTNAEAGKQAIVKGGNKFALALYDKLRTGEGNLFFSPYSISTAFAMAYAGTRGQTEIQMAKVLSFPTVPGDISGDPNRVIKPSEFHSAFGQIVKDLNAKGGQGKYELAVANALWGQKGYEFLKAYFELVETNYNSELNEVDFAGDVEAARLTINSWVEKKTNNKIKDLFAPGALNDLTRLVLTNAVYFKGKWASQFKKEDTRDMPFTLVNGSKIDVPMMNQTGKFGYMEAEDLQGLQLPYIGDELSMVILLPKKTDGLNDLEKKLTAENLSQWLEKLYKREVIVYIPKFKMESKFSLAGVLSSMGMTDAFLPDKADLSGMNGKRDLFISAVVHKAFVNVDEEGTEAAAATGIAVGITSVGPKIPIPVFQADHPFLFLIRDNQSGSILFLGRLANPASQDN